MLRPEVARLEKRAVLWNRELIAIRDGKYIALGSVSREFEALSLEELQLLQAERGEALLVVSVEKPEG